MSDMSERPFLRNSRGDTAMSECPLCGSEDIYEEYTDVWVGQHQMHCNSCDQDYDVEITGD